MKAEVKILHTYVRTARNGNPYTEVYVVIKLDGVEFVRKLLVWHK